MKLLISNYQTGKSQLIDIEISEDVIGGSNINDLQVAILDLVNESSAPSPQKRTKSRKTSTPTTDDSKQPETVDKPATATEKPKQSSPKQEDTKEPEALELPGDEADGDSELASLFGDLEDDNEPKERTAKDAQLALKEVFKQLVAQGKLKNIDVPKLINKATKGKTSKMGDLTIDAADKIAEFFRSKLD